MKETILRILLENLDNFVSGEEISKKTDVTRSAIWKQICRLKKEGYPIEGISGCGYRLVTLPDFIKQEVVGAALKDLTWIQKIHVFDSLSSTNDYLKEVHSQEDLVILAVANSQSAGRGRRGRSFDSQAGVGLYMSLKFQPRCASHELPFITGIAAAAVCIAFKNLGISSKIKWPNDILIHRKKACGILTEMTLDLDGINAVIVGIGINVKNKTFSKELQSIATSLYLQGYEQSSLEVLKEVWKEFYRLWRSFEQGDKNQVLDILREESAVIGEKIIVIKEGKRLFATGVGITESGNLTVVYENGSSEDLNSGEISLRFDKPALSNLDTI